jgi:hypothetical protein
MNRKIKLLLISVFSLLALMGCDCWTNGEGIVIDFNTNLALDSVTVKSFVEDLDNEPRREMITDSSGQYFATTGNTGFCRDLVVEFSKNGYKTLMIRNPNNDTIKLSKN